VTTPVIEASYRRILALLDAHLVGGNRFLMGARPGAGDFGFFGQLSQLAHFDPTPAALAAIENPRVVSWVSHLDDLSSLEVGDGGWLAREAAAEVLRPFLMEVGRVYAPFLIANAQALATRASEVRCEIDGRPWVQQPFPYQGKCLKWLREGRAALGAGDREFVDSVLKSTGADAMFI
jgi:Glutathione S-transferase, C-terminal domain